MNIYLRTKGVSLIELLAVIVILGVIAAFSVVMIGKLIARTEVKANEQIVQSLNDATEFYSLQEGILSSDIFEGYDTNGARISQLFELGYLSLLPQPQPPVSFNWDIDTQTWILTETVETGIITSPTIINYDFSKTRLIDVIENGGIIANGSFNDTGTSIESGYGILFIKNPLDTYTITVQAKLSEGTVGGYGIFYETKLDGEFMDTGFIVQFDRSYSNGEIIIRPRTDGKEGNVLFRYPVLFDDKGDGYWVITDGEKNRKNPWWTSIHDIKLVVSIVDESTKLIQVYIDDVYAFQYQFESTILPGETNINYTGFRSWGKVTTYNGIAVE